MCQTALPPNASMIGQGPLSLAVQAPARDADDPVQDGVGDHRVVDVGAPLLERQLPGQ